MTSAGEPNVDLVAYLYDELSPSERRSVEEQLAASPELRAELDGLRRTLDLVRSAPQPSQDVAARDRLFAVLDDALTEQAAETSAPIHSLDEYRSPLRRAWDFALYRYEPSRAVRRAVSVSLVAHAAAACFLGWMLITEARQAPMRIEIADLEPVDDGLRAEGDPDDPLDELEHLAGIDGDVPPSEADAWPAEFPQQADAGVPAWPRPRVPMSADEQLRFPTLPYMVRMRAVFDLEARRNKLERHAGELADWVPEGIDGGLDWLAENRDADGTWSPSEDAPASLRTGVTAAVVLAFSSDGRSAANGEDGVLLGPAVAHLEQELTADADADLPLSTHALALRALTQQYGVAYRHLTPEERTDRKALLERSGDALLARQREDGGFAADETLAQTDASSTLLAATALIELRVAGVIETKDALGRAGEFLEARRGTDGMLPAEAGVTPATLSAAMLSISDELSIDAGLDATLDAVAAAAEGDAGSLMTVWVTTEALKRHRRPLTDTLAQLRDRQTQTGAWPALPEVSEGGDALSTAVGVLSLTRLFLAN